MTTDREPCGECGMLCEPGEYHPYAACLMFTACRNSDTVRGNLQAVLDHGRAAAAIRAGAAEQDKPDGIPT